ncbi:transcriptional regulatory protein [Peptostreptococcaceae bacterium oral taxon 113 str. W5053]|nr:transcriptional regulatory protein [Peptostreptococcaceae bacterium oral taxon 113 str. W5053]
MIWEDVMKERILIIGQRRSEHPFYPFWINKAYRVFLCAKGQEAWECFLRESPDLVMIDKSLEDMEISTLLTYIRHMSTVPVMITGETISTEEALKLLSLEADLICRDSLSIVEGLAHGIRLMSRWEGKNNNHVKSWNQRDLVIDFPCHEAWVKGKKINLTPIEFRLLEVLSGKEKVFTREELITLAFDMDYDGYDRTVDVHIKNLRGKIQLNYTYIVTVRGLGYRFEGKSD